MSYYINICGLKTKKTTLRSYLCDVLTFYIETGKLRFPFGSNAAKVRGLSVVAAQAGGASKHSLNQFYY